MKLAESTREVLKNYSEIDPRLVYREGTSVWTQNMERSILAHAELEESIPNKGFLYDIGRLLGILSTFGKDVEVEFHDTQIALAEGDRNARITLSPPEMEPERVMERLGTDGWDDTQGTIRLAKKDLAHIMKSARIFGLGHVAFHSDGISTYLSAVDALGEVEDTASVKIAEERKGSSFKHFLGIETIKLIDSDYDVTLYERGVAVFDSVDDGAKLTYWIACEDVDVE